jgi:hypothetical protein
MLTKVYADALLVDEGLADELVAAAMDGDFRDIQEIAEATDE